MNKMGEMISLAGLTKEFGSLVAVNDITLSIAKGEVLGFLGPNGAGKSTTMKMVTGYLPITAGSARVCGHDVATKPIEVKKLVGYLPEGAPLYGDMTPAAFLGFIAEIHGFRGVEKKQRVANAVEKLELEEVFNRPIETLSKGFKRRVGLAQAILHDPQVLILDEPTDGLDPNQKHQVRNLILDMAADKAIIISTHILEEVEAVCTRAAVIAQGRLVFDGTPEQLQERSPTYNAVMVRLSAQQSVEASSQFKEIPEVVRIDSSADNPSFMVIPKDGVPILEKVGQFARERGIEIEEMYVERGQLDDVFRQLTLPG